MSYLNYNYFDLNFYADPEFGKLNFYINDRRISAKTEFSGLKIDFIRKKKLGTI